ncbi:lysophospholipid acyltransferase family protein [Actinospica robiniae]|uniref:lysophospholipid acyltransferase family protein n=1 Tax=Actinospica robiniae TaxID=304901 RepID=UPI0006866190|nr:lysophospholipid acyltransferase family protein [Actinospica robiniae]
MAEWSAVRRCADLERLGVFYAFMKVLVRRLTLVVLRPRIEGRENIPASGPVILASNHLSFIDSIIIPLVSPRRVAFLAKEEYWTTPGIKGWFMKGFFTGIGAVPVRRGDHRAAQASLDTSLEVLESGVAFGIYPEGTRSLDGRLYRAKVGVGWLALKSKAPIVPVGIVGTDEVLPVGAKFPRLIRMTLRFGEPFTADQVEFPGEAVAENSRARRAVADAVLTEIQKLSGQEYAGVYNERPVED